MGMERPARTPGGFTIIELALVLVITALLAGLAVVTYNRFADKARMTQAKTALKHLQKTETVYFTENERYTDNVARLDFDPVKYDYYEISVALDNTGQGYTGYARGIRSMLGDLWIVTKDTDPVQDNAARLRFP